MRLERAALAMLLLALLTLAFIVGLGRFWDPVIRPMIELTGATLYAMRLPLLAALILFLLYQTGMHFRRR